MLSSFFVDYELFRLVRIVEFAIKIKFRRHICHVNHLPINTLYFMEAEMGHEKRMIWLSHSDL